MRVSTGGNKYIGLSCSPEGVERHITIYIGKTVFTSMRYFKGGEEEEFILPVPEGSEIEADDSVTLYKERPQRPKPCFVFHFAPGKGWVNDPNGLVFHNGLYHMYFQHNPLSRKWGNLSWGHAVSEDLVHWKEEDPVFLPEDLTHLVYTGSSFIEDGKIAAYYTLWDSEDDSDNVVIRKESDDGYVFTGRKEMLRSAGLEARDPKVFMWKGVKYILLFLEGHDYALCREIDSEWQVTDRFSVPDGWECPNVLTYDDRLYFFTAEGYYWEARLENGRFRLEGEMRQLFKNKLAYAAQVFANTPGRQILIPWVRAKTPSLPSCGLMGIPREVSDLGGKLSLQPVMEALEALRLRPFVKKKEISSDDPVCFIFLNEAGSFSGVLNGTQVAYVKNILDVGGERVEMDAREMVLMVDHLVLEVSSSRYTENAYFELAGGNGCRLSSDKPMTGAVGLLR